ncbi:MAG: MFS transporter [Gammaproteobacteria bacterium AqS3]|nr:MFS transporter [Gammaproteobacteria bacterium AqS3]
MEENAHSPADTSVSERVTDAIHHAPIGPLQIGVFVIGFVLSMLEGFDVLAIAFASVSIQRELNLTPDQMGILFSSGLLGMMLGAMMLTLLSDLLGRRRMILAALTLSGVSMVLTPLPESLWAIAALRLLTGVGVGVLLATVATIVAEFAPVRWRSLMVNASLAGFAFGAVVGGIVSAEIIGVYGWGSIFYGGGALTLMLVLLVWIGLPESPEFLLSRRPQGALESLNRILAKLDMQPLERLDPPREEAQKGLLSGGPGQLLSSEWRGRTLLLWLSFGFSYGGLYFLLNWIPQIVNAAGASETVSIYALTAFNVGAVAGILLLGVLSGQGRTSLMVGVFFVACAASMMVFPFVQGDVILLVCGLMGGLIQGAVVGLYVCGTILYPAEVRATGVGWGIGLGRIGGVVGPYLAGQLLALELSVPWLFFIFAAPLLISAWAALRLRV